MQSQSQLDGAGPHVLGVHNANAAPEHVQLEGSQGSEWQGSEPISTWHLTADALPDKDDDMAEAATPGMP